MRIAVVSDIHGNRTAFEAVLADLQRTAPDVVLHGGDLADDGSSPAEIVDQVRALGWQGVVGNTDEMLFRPESLREVAARLPQLAEMFTAIGEMAEATREALGAERIAWLGGLPRVWACGGVALVHASTESLWRAPGPEAEEGEVRGAFGGLGAERVVYGHIHRAYVRSVAGMTVANAGSVGLSYDGDARASYLVLDEGRVEVRRVEYDVEREIRGLLECGLPHAEWVARTLRSARPQAF